MGPCPFQNIKSKVDKIFDVDHEDNEMFIEMIESPSKLFVYKVIFSALLFYICHPIAVIFIGFPILCFIGFIMELMNYLIVPLYMGMYFTLFYYVILACAVQEKQKQTPNKSQDGSGTEAS